MTNEDIKRIACLVQALADIREVQQAFNFSPKSPLTLSVAKAAFSPTPVSCVVGGSAAVAILSVAEAIIQAELIKVGVKLG